MTVKARIAGLPVIGQALLVLYRLRLAAGYVLGPVGRAVVWSFRARETTNLTYDLTGLNRRYLAALTAEVTGATVPQVLEYFCEIEQDAALREHIRTMVAGSPRGFLAETSVKLGRRLAWYAIVRVVRPQVIVETGVDKGLGSCVLTAALLRNTAEGHVGRYYGTDINNAAGYLLQGRYREVGEILFGDSLESLRQLRQPIDLMINDSDHSAAYEAEEYREVEERLTAQAIVIGDNAHATGALLDFAERTGRRFAFLREAPSGHWYPGGGIGVAFGRRP